MESFTLLHLNSYSYINTAANLQKKNDICANWIWKIHFSLEKGTIMRVEYKINAEFILLYARNGTEGCPESIKMEAGPGHWRPKSCFAL